MNLMNAPIYDREYPRTQRVLATSWILQECWTIESWVQRGDCWIVVIGVDRLNIMNRLKSLGHLSISKLVGGWNLIETYLRQPRLISFPKTGRVALEKNKLL